MDMCPETRLLMQKYTEAARLHSSFTKTYIEAQHQPRFEEFLGRMEVALKAREGAWLTWQKHLAAHGCQRRANRQAQ
jgi:hypothetical protein